MNYLKEDGIILYDESGKETKISRNEINMTDPEQLKKLANTVAMAYEVKPYYSICDEYDKVIFTTHSKVIRDGQLHEFIINDMADTKDYYEKKLKLKK